MRRRSWARVISILGASLALASPPSNSDHSPSGAQSVDQSHATASEKEGEKATRILVIEPKEKIDPRIAGEEIRKNLELARSKWKGGDYPSAERYFAAALGVPEDAKEKELVLWEMGQSYQGVGMLTKAIAAYERLTEEYPLSRRRPSAFFELGNLYREMGGLEIAIAKYYMVMSSALNVSIDQVEQAQELSFRAKMEIAETHAERSNNEEALRIYELLSRLELEPADRKRVRYRICNLLYELGNYSRVVSHLKSFLEDYDQSPHAPEIRYLLAKSYESLNRKPDALREVLTILQRQSSPDTAIENNADYWKQRMGNELANEFYKSGDYRSALAIYQSLAKYSATPEWRWPAIHQIGLCFERLGLPEKAIMAYQEIISPENGDYSDGELSPGMISLREMAKWRLEHLKWEDDLSARLNILSMQ